MACCAPCSRSASAPASKVRRCRASSARGASLLEYIALVGLIAIVSLGSYRAFGETVRSKAERQAQCVESLSGDCGGDAAGESADALSDSGAPKANPSLDGNDAAKGAKYKKVKGGKPFVEGDGDGRAIHPSDVSQGQLGDCYLLATLAEIAHVSPDFIKQHVRQRKDGKYEVDFYETRPWWKVWDDGKVTVVVKPEFPNKGGAWVFAQPGDSKKGQTETWAMVYEKAYAQWKGKGVYNAIGQGGWPSDAMRELTGKDADHLATKDLSFETFTRNVNDGKLVEASTIGKEQAKTDDLFKNGTLVSDHAYYVTAVDSKAQTVTVRNPWGWNNAPVTLSWADFQRAFPHTYVGGVR